MADLMAKKNIGKILTSQYDIALNGWEIGGGGEESQTKGGTLTNEVDNERNEMIKIVQVTESLIKAHIEELKKLGVEIK